MFLQIIAKNPFCTRSPEAQPHHVLSFPPLGLTHSPNQVQRTLLQLKLACPCHHLLQRTHCRTAQFHKSAISKQSEGERGSRDLTMDEGCLQSHLYAKVSIVPGTSSVAGHEVCNTPAQYHPFVYIVSPCGPYVVVVW